MKHILTNPYHEVLRFERGEEARTGILDFAKKKNIGAAWVWVIGAAEEVTLATYHLEEKKYEEKTIKEPLEIVSVSGNLSLKDNLPAIHLHGTFGKRDFLTVGGHIQRMMVGATMEVFIHKIDGAIHRVFDANIGLDLMIPQKP